MTPDPKKNILIGSLQKTLAGLIKNPCQHLENPDGCPRRASVALIIRIRPHFDHWPEECSEDRTESEPVDLNQFFSNHWVQYGDPEVAFIKRASREGDRWTSHVALPGGKRDPEDKDDQTVAVRETAEEIGLDLTSNNSLFIGSLSERLVSTAWGKVPFMILCPFVFLWTKADMPCLRPHPGEVASIHWVPIRILLSPSSHTHTYVDTSDRLSRRGGTVMKSVMRSILGLMEFSAIRLIPSESVYCSSTEEFFPREDLTELKSSVSLIDKLYNLRRNCSLPYSSEPLLLWGLTLGILVDFLDQLPPHNAIQLWSYPTFTAYDVRLVIKLLAIPLKRRNQHLIQSENEIANKFALFSDAKVYAPVQNTLSTREMTDKETIHEKKVRWNQFYAVGVMLEGYYDIVRTGAIFAAVLRLVVTSACTYAAVKSYKQRKFL